MTKDRKSTLVPSPHAREECQEAVAGRQPPNTPRLTKTFGQSFVVDNRGGSIGADIVARATPDGYTIITVSGLRIVGGPPRQFADPIRTDVARWSKVVAEAGIKPE